MRIGDTIYARKGQLSLSGQIICGFTYAGFSHQKGLSVDPDDVLILRLNDGERVRLIARSWQIDDGREKGA